jgi:ADP-ribose pyrophosphatase YjhB (NUDIX family)
MRFPVDSSTSVRRQRQHAGVRFDEEVGVEVSELSLVGVYSDPKRDPRGHTVSVAYLALLPRAVAPRAGSDAEGAGMDRRLAEACPRLRPREQF